MSFQSEFRSVFKQTCKVYEASQFGVHLGANEGDAIAHADLLCVGDIYRLNPEAELRTLIHTSAARKSGKHTEIRQVIASGSKVGRAGTKISPISRLTFMSARGITFDGLVLSVGKKIYFHPLTPIQPRADYTLITAEADSGYAEFANIGHLSFARGTMITTGDGEYRRVEDLRENDMVLTRDHGVRPVRSVLTQTVEAYGAVAPIIISKGAYGNAEELMVSPEHRLFVLRESKKGVLTEVPTLAKDLVDGERVFAREGGSVDYFQIELDTPELVFAEGIPAECLVANAMSSATPNRDRKAKLPALDRPKQADQAMRAGN